MPAVAATQNVLMKKLGLINGPQLETTDFGCYVQLFADGLSEHQVQLIKEMFSNAMSNEEDEALQLEAA
jgi:hypothetical protein